MLNSISFLGHQRYLLRHWFNNSLQSNTMQLLKYFYIIKVKKKIKETNHRSACMLLLTLITCKRICDSFVQFIFYLAAGQVIFDIYLSSVNFTRLGRLDRSFREPCNIVLTTESALVVCHP